MALYPAGLPDFSMRQDFLNQLLVRSLALVFVFGICGCEPPQIVSVSADAGQASETNETESDLAAAWETLPPAPPGPGTAREAMSEPASQPNSEIASKGKRLQGEAPTPNPYRNRSDAALLAKFEGDTMSEILDALVLPTEAEIAWRDAEGGSVGKMDGSRFFSYGKVKGIDGTIRDGVVADFAGDSYLDFLALRDDGTLRLYVGQPSERDTLVFVWKTDPELEVSRGGESLRAVDFDGDGNTDVLVLRGAGLPSSLLRNDEGRFKDVTIERGLLDFRDAIDGRWFDVSGDGQLDLLMANVGPDEICALYIADSDGHLVDQAEEWGLSGAGEGIRCLGLLDADCDGSLDVLLNGLPRAENSAVGWYRKGKGKQLEKIALQKDFPSGDVKVADLDNDGREDLLLSDGEQWSWWRNGADAEDWPLFENVSEPAGLQDFQLAGERGVLIADFDGDGLCDLLGGAPLRLLLNRGGSHFVDAGKEGANLQPGGGEGDWRVAEDFDTDGDMDILSYSHVLSGRATEDAQWIRLESTPQFRGSMLTLTILDKSWIQNSIHRRLDTRGRSVIPIGLGEAEKIVSIEIDGRVLTTDLETVRPGQTISLEDAADRRGRNESEGK